MKGIFVGLIVLGGVALVGGAALFAYGLSKNSSNSELVTHEYTFEDNIDSINVDLNTANLEFKKAEDDKTKVVCVEKEKVYHVVEAKSDTLSIKIQDERKWYQKYLLNFSFQKMTVTVYLPEASYKDVVVDADTSNILINKEFTFDNINLKTSTGNMKIYSSVTNKIDLKMSTGDVTLDNVNAKNIKSESSTGKFIYTTGQVEENIEVKTSTGDIRFDHVKAQNLNAKASTGDVKLVDTVVDKHIEIKTSTGDVRFDRSDAETITVDTSTGYIKGTLLTPKKFDVDYDTTKPKLPPVDTWDGGLCKLSTDTGAIDISIA